MTNNEAYMDFMYNRSNSHCCDKCPENIDASAWPGNRLPCGQFNCWVDLHCDRSEDHDE